MFKSSYLGVSACAHVRAHARTHTRTHACIHVSMYLRAHTSVCMNVFACFL